ncbi:MAG: substrate-binding domain-containing protein [Thermomicrobiales bacterium]|nr:substrate-binding domain-containing protein [Thermomicrobiales bacterium]
MSRRRMLMTSGAIGAAAASLGVPASMLAAPSSTTRSYRIRSQEGSKRVIFVTHDDNPFFIPVRFALEEFGEMAGWETQWVGPPQHDEQATLQFQLDAIAAQPLAIGFTRVNTTMFDEPIQQAQEAGIFAILYNTASEGYQDLGVAYVGQDFIPAGIVNGRNAAKYAQEITGRTDGEIILGTIAPGHSALDARMEGTRQGIAAYNEENGTSYTTSDLTTSTDGPTAIAALDAVYAEKGDAIVGFAHADYVNWFTGTWIEQQGLEGRFSNGGFDLLPGVMDAIQVGTSQWAIGQNPYAQGWMTAALIHMATAHGYPAFSYDTGAEIVDLSNIDAVAAREAIFAE